MVIASRRRVLGRANHSRAFLIQAPLTFVAFLSVFFVLKLPKTDDAEWKVKLRRVDFLGAFILVAAVFTLLLGLDRGGNVRKQLRPRVEL